jgi:hypothetical protein
LAAERMELLIIDRDKRTGNTKACGVTALSR